MLEHILQWLESAKHGRAETIAWLQNYCVPFLLAATSCVVDCGFLISGTSTLWVTRPQLNRNSCILKDFHFVGVPSNILI